MLFTSTLPSSHTTCEQSRHFCCEELPCYELLTFWNLHSVETLRNAEAIGLRFSALSLTNVSKTKRWAKRDSAQARSLLTNRRTFSRQPHHRHPQYTETSLLNVNNRELNVLNFRSFLDASRKYPVSSKTLRDVIRPPSA
uniref:Uncharacterized protein n=1 Tax=Rhipicephalus zambeziensis TaxID=60191 RepID=A0A224YFV3_9ACAR